MKFCLSLHQKMMVYLIPIILLVFGISIVYLIKQSSKIAIQHTQRITDESAEKFAHIVKSGIDREFDLSRGLAFSFSTFETLSNKDRGKVYTPMIESVMKGSPQALSYWYNFELKFVDENFHNKSGRVRNTIYRDDYGNIKTMHDTLDTDNLVTKKVGSYQQMKISKEETLVEPYYDTYSGNKQDLEMMSSVCIPILKNGEFAGLVGCDISLEYFKELIGSIDVFGGGYAFLFSNGGQFVAFPNEELVGGNFSEYFPDIDHEHNILNNIANGKTISYQGIDLINGEESYITYIPIVMGKTVTPWCFAVSVPYGSIIAKAKKTALVSMLFSLLGIVIFSIVIYFIARNITSPLKRTTKVLKNLSEGDIKENDKLKIKSGDEIEDMANSLNYLIDGLGRTAEFARTIGKGDLEADYKKVGENDILGSALLEMRQNLIFANEEESKRKLKDEKQNWATQGLAKFGEILRQHNQDIEELSFSIMSNLVDYVDAIQGGLFVKNTDEEDVDNVTYDLTGAIAYDRKKTMQKQFKKGESLVGRCAYEKLTIYMEDVPEDYVHVTSGLGEANPRSILIVPAILNDEVYAIIELVSFSKFEPHQIEFVEKLGESIASTIANARVNGRTNKLLEQSKQQSEELAAQEEEMRQNMEELQATQEEMSRKENESRNLIEKMQIREEQLYKILDEIDIKEDEVRARLEKIKEI